VKLGPNDEVLVSNAGHLAPYRNGEELAIEAGLPLGLISDLKYAESRLVHFRLCVAFRLGSYIYFGICARRRGRDG
jgi:hypothetical protein